MPEYVTPSAESSLALSFVEAKPSRSSHVSPLEDEVVELFNRFRNPLLRYVLSFSLSAEDGEEIVQEVFLALFQHLQRGKPRSNLRGWVFRVGHNLALKQRTRVHQRTSFQCGEDLAQQQCDARPGPDEQLVTAQRRQRLLKVVGMLPEQDRYCLYLRAEGLRYREIVEVLGMSLGAVSLSLTRSLARLGRADGA